MTLNLDKAKDRAKLASIVALAERFGVCVLIQCEEPKPAADGRKGARHPRLKEAHLIRSRIARTM